LVEQILSRDKQAMKHMPKVMQDQLKKSGGSRSFSTSARSRMPDVEGVEPRNDANLFASVPGAEGASAEAAAALASMIEQVQSQAVEENPGLKFEQPTVPENLKTLNFRNRYDTLQDQFTKMMMESGKLTKAQKVRVFFISFVCLESDIADIILEHGHRFGPPSHCLSSPDQP
jgi:hypothetical protein